MKTGLFIALGIGAAACTVQSPQRARPALALVTSATISAAPASSSNVPHGPDTAAAPSKAVALLTDPAVLVEVARTTGDLGALVDGSPARGATAAELARRPEYARIVGVLRTEVESVVRGDPLAGTSVARSSHRAFDVRWLASEHARFDLVGVANRIDRRPFHPNACGEVRLVYRLAYSTSVGATPVRSRLPVTLIAELLGADPDADGSCRSAARRWLAPATLSGADLGRWLVRADGPLAASRISRERVAQLAANVQVVRWPSTVRPDLGGHAEYVLRGFELTGGHWTPKPLENTPDVARLRADPRLRRELFEWITAPEHLAQIDSATADIPRAFLAMRAVSVTPRGFGRLGNRPFRQLFAPKDFVGVDLRALAFARSPEALIRRLDEQSCSGCHQSRSLAGFHLLGEDPDGAASGNGIATAFSPHLSGELARRTHVLEELAAGRTVSFARPLAEHPVASPGGYGAHCGLADPGFADWTCEAGLVCTPLDEPAGETPTVGVCLPRAPSVGDPCEASVLSQTSDPRRDRLQSGAAPACSDEAPLCIGSAVGFPAGMCAASCAALPAHGTCGAIAELDPFNACLARGEPFGECAVKHSNPSGLRSCSLDEPCRDDYLCARTPTGAGACIPPYFLFQLRVDGHPPP